MGKNSKGSKTNKGHHKKGPKYVANADEIEARNDREPKKAGEGEDSDVDSLELSDDEDDIFDRSGQAAEEAPKQPKAKGVAGLIETQNPNAAQPRNMKLKDLGKALPEAEAPRLSRREREELEAQRKRERYEKLHKEGKTDEYKKDMERLQAARARREAAAEKKDTEREQAQAAAEALKEAAAAAQSDDEEEKLDPREIKKMNPKQLKDHLKARGLSTQGQKKDLMQRLLDA